MDLSELYLQEISSFTTFPVDFDKAFLENFVDTVLPEGLDGLKKLVKFFPAQQQDSVSDASGSSQILLALYVQALIKLTKSGQEFVLDQSVVRSFLREHQTRLFAPDSQPILQQLVYEFLCEIEQGPALNPFEIDNNVLIRDTLANERTNICVRGPVEKLAKLRIARRPGHDAEESRLFDDLLDVLTCVDCDFAPVAESLSRVLATFVEQFTKDQRDKTIRKAKETRRIGAAFAKLTAKLILLLPKTDDLRSVSEGFSDSYTQSVVLAQLLELDQESFDARALIDLLAKVSGNNLNFIVPHLPKIDFPLPEEFTHFLDSLIPSTANPRNCSDSTLRTFLTILRENDKEWAFFPKLFDSINLRILNTPSLLTSFSDDPSSAQRSFDEVFSHTNLATSLRKIVQEYLLEFEANAGEQGWEERDSVIELLHLCGDYLDLDEDLLSLKLFNLANSTEENSFVRANAVKYLCRKYPADVLSNFEALYWGNTAKETRLPLIESVASSLQNANESTLIDFCANAIRLIDDLVHQDDEEVSVAAARLCKTLVERIPTTAEGACPKEVLAELVARKEVLEGVVKLDEAERQRKKGHREDIRAQIEDLIETLTKGCAKDDDQCVSKECY